MCLQALCIKTNSFASHGQSRKISSKKLLPAQIYAGDTQTKATKFALSLVAVALLSISALASDKMNASIQIQDAVHVGSTLLAPGQYRMTWTESGTRAEVTFLQGKKVIATVPAQVSQARSGYDGPVLHTDTVANTLAAVALPKMSFVFSNDNALQG
jgi:YD repeat-containing protein